MQSQPEATETKRYENLRALSLYCLVSHNISAINSNRDFYTGILPFFEPFVREHRDEILDVPLLLKYAKTKLMLPMTEDIARLFVERMHGAGWLEIAARTKESIVYRCTPRDLDHRGNQTDVNGELDRLLTALREFLTSHSASFNALSDADIEESFLRFLARNLSPTRAGIGIDYSTDEVHDSIEYWFARFIAQVGAANPEAFRTIERIAGISLMTEAIMEIRSPSASMAKRKNVTVYIDGPMLMDYLGLSGVAQRNNVAFIIDKLKKLGIDVRCFRHTCDEIRDNLRALFNRHESQRTGPTANAIRKREVRREYAMAVRDNVEHFVEKTARLGIDPDKPDNFRSMEEYCDDTTVDELARYMPAQNAVARDRDAWSVGVIMRRREGYENTDLFQTRFLLVTSNPDLVATSNSILRKKGALSPNRAAIGPALHHRVISGILFANSGIDERAEVSRRQLLASCEEVVRIRPKILEGFIQQIGLWKSEENPLVIDALLSQPRATEILMDYSVGKGCAVSRSNLDEILEELKRASADDVRNELEGRFADERARLQAEREQQEAKHQAAVREIETANSTQFAAFKQSLDEVASRMDELQRANIHATETATAERERAIAARKKLALTAYKVAGTSLRSTKTIAFNAMVLTAALLAFAAIWGTLAAFFRFNETLALLVSILLSTSGAIGLALSGWNYPITVVEDWFATWSASRARRALTNAGLEELSHRLAINYREGRVRFLTDEDLASQQAESSAELPKLESTTIEADRDAA